MPQEIQSIRNVTKNYGSRPTQMKYGGRADRAALIKTAMWSFNYDDLPAGGASNLEQRIPAGSTIVSARFRVITAFTSTSTTSDLTVGLQTSAGVEIDNDGLLLATALTQTTIAVAGAIYTGTGALVGKTIGATAGELVVAPTVADLLTGRAEVIVEYMTPAALPA